MVLGAEAVLADLCWDEDRTDETEAALAELADHIGLVSQRPEQDFGRGSDVLWALGRQTYAVIEAKSGSKGEVIWKRDINQLAGSAHWCQEEYGSDAKVLPVVMHRSNMVQRGWHASSGNAVLTVEKLDRLKVAFRAFVAAIAHDYGYRDAEKVARQLEQHHLGSDVIILRYTRRRPTRGLAAVSMLPREESLGASTRGPWT